MSTFLESTMFSIVSRSPRHQNGVLASSSIDLVLPMMRLIDPRQKRRRVEKLPVFVFTTASALVYASRGARRSSVSVTMKVSVDPRMTKPSKSRVIALMIASLLSDLLSKSSALTGRQTSTEFRP